MLLHFQARLARFVRVLLNPATRERWPSQRARCAPGAPERLAPCVWRWKAWCLLGTGAGAAPPGTSPGECPLLTLCPGQVRNSYSRWGPWLRPAALGLKPEHLKISDSVHTVTPAGTLGSSFGRAQSPPRANGTCVSFPPSAVPERSARPHGRQALLLGADVTKPTRFLGAALKDVPLRPAGDGRARGGRARG